MSSPTASTTPADAHSSSSRERWIAMAVLLVAGFMNLIDVTIVNVALPSMQEALNATPEQIEWVVAIYILVFALCLIPGGRAGDIFGRRKVFVAGIVLFTIGSTFCGLAPSIEALVASRAVQGVGGAMMIPQTLAMVPTLFPPQERGAAFALFGLSAGLASVSGPIIGGLLIGADIGGLDWRPIFLVNIPVGLAAICAALWFLPKIPARPDIGIDIAGTLLAALALFFVVFPLIEGRALGWPLWCFIMMGASLPVAGAFVFWQRRQARYDKAQLLPAGLLANRGYLLGVLLAAILFSGIPGFFLIMALFLQSGFGLTPLESGLTTLPFSVGVLLASLVAGRLGNRVLLLRITTGAAMLSCCMVWLGFLAIGLGDKIAMLAFVPPLLLGGLGMGTAVSPLFNTILASVSDADSGSASGALQAFQQVGGALGVAIVGQIFFSRLDAFASPGSAAAHETYRAAYVAGVGYPALAFALLALLVWFMPKPTLITRAAPPASM